MALRGSPGRQRGASPPRRPCSSASRTMASWSVARASQTAFELVKRYKLSEAATWTQAAYSGNRIYVKDVTNLTFGR